MAASKEIKLEKSAVKFISKQQLEQRKRLFKAIKGLPDEGDIKKMHGYKSLYRPARGGFQSALQNSNGRRNYYRYR